MAKGNGKTGVAGALDISTGLLADGSDFSNTGISLVAGGGVAGSDSVAVCGAVGSVALGILEIS
jgi:hypothetical protein